ncbi:hypothetical protein LSCM1_00127 [Leishmania martiniquensis]|uniref:Uncharacterized protein n=1 Tax=Leishmania martiniquensis TaxID=1580590 RepID=A0A836GHE5_9TRYP|nr:hypothetical protein LSCM1_00127 [Leishmania martiniquensis]
MRCSSSTPAAPPAVTRSSNLWHYRALLQVLAYASEREQTAEQVVRDALTGGVVVPFTVTLSTSPPDVGMKTKSLPQATPPDVAGRAESQSSGGVSISTLLLPSSKFIGTTASLLADGFFCFAPLSSTVENPRRTSYQHRSECQPRDLFTLLILLFPECFIAEKGPHTGLAMRDREGSASQTQSSNRAESDMQQSCPASRSSPPSVHTPFILPHGLITPSAQRIHASVSEGQGSVAGAEPLLHSVNNAAVGGFPAAPFAISPPQQSPANLLQVDAGGSDGECLGGDNTTSSAATNVKGFPVVNTVLLSLDVLDVLLESRRSLAIVLLSLMNDALREVQYRQLEQSQTAKPATGKTPAARHPSCEGGVLQFSAEVLLTAKLLLMSVISASAVWRHRVSVAVEITNAALQEASLPPSPPPPPSHVLSELLGEETEEATAFLTAPVEQWIWGREKGTLGQWYDRLLDRLLMATDRAGVQLDAYLRAAKWKAVSSGCSVSSFPTLLLHRPSDGQPAVEMSLASIPPFSGVVRLPSLPIQQGEVHMLLCPTVLDDKAGVVQARGHELLLDSTSSPTADFFQACASTVCTEAQLQPCGDAVPWLFRHRLADLSSTEQGIIAAALCDPSTLSAVLEKNAAMLARLTLWCRDRWPPPSDAASVLGSAPRRPNDRMVNSGRKSLHSIGDEVEQQILFQRPFNAAVGRYVRELVTLKGLSKDVLEAWMRHICKGVVATEGSTVDGSVSSSHRSMFLALVKFAVLHNRWRLHPEVEALQKEYVSCSRIVGG